MLRFAIKVLITSLAYWLYVVALKHYNIEF